MTSALWRTAGFCQDLPVDLPELITALSFALDLTEGAAPGHGLRCCLLGMRLAMARGLDEHQLTPLYYALQLKDIGCSNNAARMTQVVGGDDRAVKAVAKLADWTSIVRSSDLRTIRSLWRHVLPDASAGTRLARMAALGIYQRRNNREMIELRCERGSQIVRKLEMGDLTAETVLRLDEHWDGSGYPGGLRGAALPLPSRICAVAQILDVFATVDGQTAAMSVLRRRSGSWFDPDLVVTAEQLHREGQLWLHCAPFDAVQETRREVMKLEPQSTEPLCAQYIDTICEGFADVVDAKSPFTYRHSVRVTEVADALAAMLQLTPERRKMVHRAALLHDIGKLSVPNTILDKPGPLNAREWAIVATHPRMTRSILERVSSFRELAIVAAEHHERLDGSGYPMGLKAVDISLESRLLAISDQFAGMTERRPYDPGYDPAEALELIREEVPAKLDPTCFEALEALVQQTELIPPGEVLDSLTPPAVPCI